MDSSPDPNEWRVAQAGYSTTPTGITPYEGSNMAIYDTGLLSPSGSLARLYCPTAIDLTTISGPIELNFWMYLSSYSSSYTDSVTVQVSTDGTTWDDIANIRAYDATNPGWVEQKIDLSAYAGQMIYIGFLGEDGGYIDIVIDDIRLNAVSTAVEYNETVYINVTDEPAIFPDWTPDDWQSGENVDIEYFVEAWTSLPGDENPDNDYKSTRVTLSYPYLHDLEMVEIISPVDDGPAQTFNVSAKITNSGQFSESGFTTNIEIGKRIYGAQWTTVEHSGGVAWDKYARGSHTYEVGGTGDYYAQAWDVSGQTADCSIVSTALDYTGYSTATLQGWMNYQDYAGYGYAYVRTYSGGYGPAYYEEELLYVTDDDIPRDVGLYRTLTMNVGTYTDPSEVYVEWYFNDESYNIGWGFGIDDIEFPELGIFESFEGIFPPAEFSVNVEYDEDVTTSGDINPGDELIIEFPAWTPDDIALGISGSIDYEITATVNLTIDTNNAMMPKTLVSLLTSGMMYRSQK
jgi:hypothetical protein